MSNKGFIPEPPTPVDPNADITIEYGGNLIGGLSDSGTVVLKTAGCLVPDDIYVHYTKSASDTSPITSQTYNVVITDKE